MRRRTYNKKKRSWNPWSVLWERPAVSEQLGCSLPSSTSLTYNFCHGGYLRLYPSVLSKEQQTAVTEELLQCPYFRQYTIQNNPEPRAHFLLHKDATEDFDGQAQPGYRYGSIRMKARPLPLLPQVQRLSSVVERLVVGGRPRRRLRRRRRSFWNVGVNPVLYRDGRDRIGFHADDDQAEEQILTALVSSPAGTTRRVCIRPKSGNSTTAPGNHQVGGDEQFELFLDAGDAYLMDGEMQQHYVHSVPSDKKSVDDGSSDGEKGISQQKRIAIVFRRGLQLEQANDSGKPSASLQPRVQIPYIFGGMKSTIQEGSTYSRIEINNLHAHLNQRRGISGNQDVGCDAIIVSGLRQDGMGNDRLFRLEYAATSEQGALSILKSCIKDLPIRVFRSSVLKSPFKAVSKTTSPACYRYDGLYKVKAVRFYNDISERFFCVACPAVHAKSRIPSSRVYLFLLVRADAGDGPYANALSSEDFLRHTIERQTMSLEAKESLRLPSAKGNKRAISNPSDFLSSSAPGPKTTGKRKKRKQTSARMKRTKNACTVTPPPTAASVEPALEND